MRFNRRIRFKINLDTYLATLRELRPKQEHAIFLTPSFLMAFSALKAYRPMYFSDSTGSIVDYSFILNECQPCCAVYSAVEICGWTGGRDTEGLEGGPWTEEAWRTGGGGGAVTRRLALQLGYFIIL